MFSILGLKYSFYKAIEGNKRPMLCEIPPPPLYVLQLSCLFSLGDLLGLSRAIYICTTERNESIIDGLSLEC